jgi:hypothetical protein
VAQEQGNKASKDGNHELAITLFSQAIEKDPTSHIYYANRSGVYLVMRKADLALADADACIKLQPTWPKVAAIRWERVPNIGLIHGVFLVRVICGGARRSRRISSSQTRCKRTRKG